MSGAQREQARALVTGATGLIGGAIVLGLLGHTGKDIYCVVRCETPAGGRARLSESLQSAAELYGYSLDLAAVQRRCIILPGDVTLPNFGLEVHDMPRDVYEAWHCAASLKFAERDRQEIESHNISGTANFISFAKMAAIPVINYVSTAYVAGQTLGRIFEIAADSNQQTNNVYEESKIRAEAIIGEAGFDITRILRPSIVIGNTETFACPSSTGIYGFIDELVRFKAAVQREVGDLLTYRGVSLVGDPDTRINLVPVDAVTDIALEISRRSAPSGIYHLASLNPPTLGEGIRVLMESIGLKPARFVEGKRQLNSIDSRFNEKLAFHGPYLLQDKEFDCDNTLRYATSSAKLRAGMDSSVLRRHVDAYLKSINYFDQNPLPVDAECR